MPTVTWAKMAMEGRRSWGGRRVNFHRGASYSACNSIRHRVASHTEASLATSTALVRKARAPGLQLSSIIGHCT